jgi:hypothetical protein
VSTGDCVICIGDNLLNIPVVSYLADWQGTAEIHVYYSERIPAGASTISAASTSFLDRKCVRLFSTLRYGSFQWPNQVPPQIMTAYPELSS